MSTGGFIVLQNQDLPMVNIQVCILERSISHIALLNLHIISNSEREHRGQQATTAMELLCAVAYTAASCLLMSRNTSLLALSIQAHRHITEGNAGDTGRSLDGRMQGQEKAGKILQMHRVVYNSRGP